MVASPGMLYIAGKTLQEACAARAVPARFKVPLLPAQSIRLAQRKELQLLSSFLYYLKATIIGGY